MFPYIMAYYGFISIGFYLLSSYKEAKDKRAWAKEVLVFIVVLILMIAISVSLFFVPA